MSDIKTLLAQHVKYETALTTALRTSEVALTSHNYTEQFLDFTRKDLFVAADLAQRAKVVLEEALERLLLIEEVARKVVDSADAQGKAPLSAYVRALAVALETP